MICMEKMARFSVLSSLLFAFEPMFGTAMVKAQEEEEEEEENTTFYIILGGCGVVVLTLLGCLVAMCRSSSKRRKKQALLEAPNPHMLKSDGFDLDYNDVYGGQKERETSGEFDPSEYAGFTGAVANKKFTGKWNNGDEYEGESESDDFENENENENEKESQQHVSINVSLDLEEDDQDEPLVVEDPNSGGSFEAAVQEAALKRSETRAMKAKSTKVAGIAHKVEEMIESEKKSKKKNNNKKKNKKDSNSNDDPNAMYEERINILTGQRISVRIDEKKMMAERAKLAKKKNKNKTNAKALRMMGITEEDAESAFDTSLAERMRKIAAGATSGGVYSTGFATASLGDDIIGGFSEKRARQEKRNKAKKQREENKKRKEREAQKKLGPALAKSKSKKNNNPKPPESVKPGKKKYGDFLSKES